MYKEILQSLPNISVLAIISMMIFLVMFLGVCYWAIFKADKKYISKMARLPLNVSDSPIQNGE